jgi:CHAT domain-containing protein
MSQIISIMVNAIGQPTDPVPQFLCERNGAWQMFGSGPLDAPLAQLQSTLRKRLDLTMDAFAVNPATPAGMLDGIGATLYEQILPEKLRQLLTDAAAQPGADVDPPEVRIHIAVPSLDWIPWELMRDPKDYLGVRFRIARFPVSQTIPVIDETTPREVQSITHLLGQQVLDPHSPLEATWLQTFAPPAAVQQVVMPQANGANPPNWPTRKDVTEAMMSDILHITCHGKFDDDDQSYYWEMDPKSTLGSLGGVSAQNFAVLQLTQGRPLIFANACAVAGATKGVITSFGRDFFTRGAQNAVGTFARLTTATAIPFAQAFYKHLLVDGMPIGRALVEAKRDFHKGPDPSHLFYCLYGPPGTRFKYPA